LLKSGSVLDHIQFVNSLNCKERSDFVIGLHDFRAPLAFTCLFVTCTPAAIHWTVVYRP